MHCTVTAKLPVTNADQLSRLLERCADIFNLHVDWAVANDTHSKSKANAVLYAQCRSLFPEVPSALVQATRDQAMEAVKAWQTKTVQVGIINAKRTKQNIGRAAKGKRLLKLRTLPKQPTKRPTSAIRYDQRTLTKRGDQLTVSSIGKRLKCIIQIVDYFRPITDNPAWKLQGATIGYQRKIGRNKMAKLADGFVVKLIYVSPDPEPSELEGLLGLDLGIINMVTLSDGTMLSDKLKRASQRRYLHNRTTLQTKGTRAAKRRLRAMSGREQRFSRDVDHCLSKYVATLPASVFAIEDLTDIRDGNRGRRVNKWLGSWTFSQFRFFLSYKAKRRGKAVIAVDARYTSQKCSACGHTTKKNRHGELFCCKKCKFTAHADVNAAINIRHAALLQLAKMASGPKRGFMALQLLRRAGASDDAINALTAAASSTAPAAEKHSAEQHAVTLATPNVPAVMAGQRHGLRAHSPKAPAAGTAAVNRR